MKHLFAFILTLFLLTAVSAQEDSLFTSYPIISRDAWQAKPAKSYIKHKIERVTVHHEGGRILKVEEDATQRLRNIQSWCMGPDRNWTDIPYHYLIAPDGTVYEGRDVLTVGETNTNYDPTGHLLISFLGNYNEQEMNENLENVLVNLLTHFCEKYNICPETIATHRDYTEHTNCPGQNLYPYFENKSIITRVKQHIAKE